MGAAAAAWEEIGRPYPAAVARWREAEALVAAGDRARPRPAAAGGAGSRERLGSRWLAEEVHGAGRARAGWISARPRDRRQAAPRAGAEDPFGLTPRERQVLALLAEGATNRQIGAALFMAEKTASVHVSRILAKLGVQGRTQAAALAHRQHLA